MCRFFSRNNLATDGSVSHPDAILLYVKLHTSAYKKLIFMQTSHRSRLEAFDKTDCLKTSKKDKSSGKWMVLGHRSLLLGSLLPEGMSGQVLRVKGYYDVMIHKHHCEDVFDLIDLRVGILLFFYKHF